MKKGILTFSGTQPQFFSLHALGLADRWVMALVHDSLVHYSTFATGKKKRGVYHKTVAHAPFVQAQQWGCCCPAAAVSLGAIAGVSGRGRQGGLGEVLVVCH